MLRVPLAVVARITYRVHEIIKIYEDVLFFAGALIFFLFGVCLFLLPPESSPQTSVQFTHASARKATESRENSVVIPTEVRGLYMSGYVAGDRARREKLFKLIDDTELNAVVIDLKDSTGYVFFDPRDESIRSLNTYDGRIKDLDEMLLDLRKRGIWTIARIVVFQDPQFADRRPDLVVKSKRTGKAWRDRRGIRWIDTASRDAWDYNLAIAKEAVARGFNEVQFDYIRFPSDGDIADMAFPVWDGTTPKYDVLRSFFRYIDERLEHTKAKTSVDLFGLTMSRVENPNDDLGIGQRIVDAAPYIDFISPMVYPSHYPPTFEGYANPAAHPYEIVDIALKDAAPAFEGARAKVRPWLQDFDLGADYTAAMVKAQIKASRDNGASGWLLWNPSNIYTAGALAKETK